MQKITFNRVLGEELMEKLLEAYDRKDGIHRYRPEEHAPQHLFVPEGVTSGSLRWRRWIYRASGSDYRTQSMFHYSNHASLHARFPKLYSWHAANFLPEVLEQILQDQGFSKWRSMAAHLPVLAGTLHDEFLDDPIHLYRGGSIDEFLKFKARFKREQGYEGVPGFGPKIASLLAIFLEEKGLVKIEDALPVDVWVQNIFISNGIVTLHDIVSAGTLENEIRLFLCDLCARRNWNRVKLSHALWFLGNKGCKDCYRRPEMEFACALWNGCRGKAAARNYRDQGLWDPSVPAFRRGGSRVFRLEPIPADSPQLPLFGADD